jgi:transposase
MLSRSGSISPNLFLQLHGEDAARRIVLQTRLRHSQVEAFFAKLPPSRTGIESCGSVPLSQAKGWGRTLRALGPDVRPIPTAYVTPFVKRNKDDVRAAAAIYTSRRRIFWSSSARNS